MRPLTCTTLLGLVLAAAAAGATDDWTALDAIPAELSSVPVPFSVALRPANAAKVDRLVEQLSDIEGARYGRYLGGDAVSALTATDAATVARVVRALAPAQCDRSSL